MRATEPRGASPKQSQARTGRRVTITALAAMLGVATFAVGAPAEVAEAQAPEFIGVATATNEAAAVLPAVPVAQLELQTGRHPEHATAVSTEPVNWTPQILDGKVSELDQIDDMIVVGGRFDQVAPPTGSPVQVQPNLFAFDATDGTISSTFTPSVEKEIRAVEPGPVPGTVYVGGGIDGINGENGKLFLLNLSDGSIVPTFDDPPLNGAVNDLALVGDTLYVGGIFSTAAGQPYQGLLALDALTGAIDPTFNINLTENHSWTEGGDFARAGVGAREFDVDPSGSTLAVVGNFRKADGLDRRQMVVIDLTGPTAEVRPDWRTQGYEPTCGRVFDSYMRDIKFSPDGQYVTVVTTGGPRPPTLCDTVVRFDMSDTGDDIQPIWANYTGGDTLLSVAATGAAVYTGGHQRWMNNLTGRDNADPGAVPRPGLSGHDSDNGVPLSWNPGRNPRGVGAESLLVTDAGLWVGSDTVWIGNFQKFRPRIAFFPLAGGEARGPENAADLPANLYRTGPTVIATTGNPLYRVNAGDTALPALDGGIPWSDDSGNDNVLRNSGSRVGGPNPITSVTAEVPASAPIGLYSKERWDPGSAGDGSEMEWEFPVAAGTEIDVRLYLANGCNCTNDPGERLFDVSIDGNVVLDDYDIVADVGHRIGTMKEFRIISDGVVDIDFGHVVENSLINAIEIIEPDDDAEPPVQPDLDFERIFFEGTSVDPNDLNDGPASDMDWNDVVDAFMVDTELFYVTTNSEFFRRTFDGQTFGPAEIVDPYNDPFWSDKDSGKVVYRGTVPTFYGQIPSVTGLAFSDGRLFYTQFGSNDLHVRWFVPESGVLNEVTRTVEGFSNDNAGDIFIDETAGLLYFVDLLDGTLFSMALDGESVSGSPTAVSGPGIDGMDWRSTALFVGPDLPSQAPVAVATADCTGLDCGFDGADSTDADGTVESYLWDFGDGSTSTEVAPAHTYAGEDTYTVTLTVTDDSGTTGSVSIDVIVEAPNVEPTAAATFECIFLDCTFAGQASSDTDGDIVSYLWDFGDGTTSTEIAPNHTYATGTYTITLTVTDDEGAVGVWTADVTVDVANTAPVAVIDASCDRLVCSFEGAGSSDADGTVDSYLWDFGDGDSSTEATVEHTYAADGSYDVTLTVTDDDGAQGTVMQTVTVERGNDDPVAEAVIACDRLQCTYDASGSTDVDGTIETFAWTFGDGETSDQAVGVHTYAADGEYTVTLTVTDDDGAVNTVSQLINPVANMAPVAAIGLPSCSLLACDFSGTDSSDPEGDELSFAWDFGDATTGIGENVSHEFGAAGTYDVTLTVTDLFGLTSSVVREVTVSDVPVTPLQAPQSVAVESLSVWTPTPAVSVPADVQEGDVLVLYVSSNQNPNPSAPAGVGDWIRQERVVNGALSVTVFTRVADGSEAGQAVTVTLPSRYRSVLTLAAYRGVAPDGIEAFATHADQGVLSHTTPEVTSAGDARRELSYWTDRSSSTTAWTAPADVSVLSSEIGNEAGRVTTLFGDRVVGAGDQGGLTATTNAASTRAVSITILLAPAEPEPNQAPSAVIGLPSCTLLECVFSGADSSDPEGDDLSFAWDFGDGSTDTGDTVLHEFGAPGTYSVSLTVTDVFGLLSTVSRDVTVSDVPVAPLVAPQLVGVESDSVWTATPSVPVPADVQAGDVMVLFVSSNQNPNPAAPSGVGTWEREDRIVNGALSVTVFTRVADGSEAGQTVTVTLPSRYRSVLTLAAYRGVATDGVEAFATATDQGASLHTTPTVTSEGDARRELSYWTDRSSSTTTWTAPAGVTELSSDIGTQAGRVTTLLGDRVVDAGEQGGLTAATDAASSRAVSITILLTPAPVAE